MNMKAGGKTGAKGALSIVKPGEVTNPVGSTDYDKMPKGPRIEKRSFQRTANDDEEQQFVVIVPDKDGVDVVFGIAHSKKQLSDAAKALADYLK